MDQKILEQVHKLRENPLALDEFLFSKKYSLTPHQRFIYRAIEGHQFTFVQGPRASAKSYTTCRYVNGYALRFPGTRIIVSGPSYRQSKDFWRTCRDILFDEGTFEWDAFIARHPTESTDAAVLTFHNKSQIIALPASGPKLHGKRGQMLILTEFFEYPEELYKTTVLPMLAKKEKGRSNKVVYETTAGFEFQFSFREYSRILDEARKGNPRYTVVSVPFHVLLKEGWDLDLEIIEATRSVDQEAYKQQYENKWLSDSGSFYILSLMMQDKLKQGQILMKGRPGREYVMALDTARSSRGKGDDSSIAIVEVGVKPSIVYLWSINNVTADDLASEVKRRIDLFPGITTLIVDPQGGGEYVMDPLREQHQIIRVDEPINVAGRRLITPFVSTSEQINLGHTELRSAFEIEEIVTPARPEEEFLHGVFVPVDPNVLIAYREIESAFKQLASLQTERLQSGYLKFSAPSKQKKDKAYALMYAFWGARRILESRKQLLVPEELGDPVMESKFGEMLIYAQIGQEIPGPI